MGDQHQDPIRIAMGQTRHRRVDVLMQRVIMVVGDDVEFIDRRHCLEPDHVAVVLCLHQGRVVGGDSHAKALQAFFQIRFESLIHGEDLFQGRDVTDHMF